jgi:hypothetical protein
MRVWDLNDGIPYVWNGTTYSSENSVSIGGSGTVNKIPKFATSTTVADSLIYDDGTYVGVGNTTPVYNLDVTGAIRTTDGFIGNGATISNINADNITSGKLTLNRIQNTANANWIQTSGVGGSGQVTWVNPTTITVGNATSAVNATNAAYATQVNVNSLSLSGLSNLVFANSTGNTVIYTNTTTAPKVNPSNGYLGLGTGTSTISTRLRSIQTGDNISASYNSSYTNFLLNTISTGTTLNMRRFISGVTYSSYWWSRGDSGYSYDELAFAGRAYLSVNGSGTSNSRLLTFQGPGDPDAIRFYFNGNSGTVSNVGGAGVYIARNLSVDGDMAIVSSTASVSCAKTINATRYVTDFTNGTSGLSATDTSLASTNYDRIVYVSHSSTGSAGAQVYVETTSGSYIMIGRLYNAGYAGLSAIIPANKRFKIYLEYNSGSNVPIAIYIYKFGRG